MVTAKLSNMIVKMRGLFLACLLVPFTFTPPAQILGSYSPPSPAGIWDTSSNVPLTTQDGQAPIISGYSEKRVDGFYSYTVQNGDTLQAIASRFRTTVRMLATVNPELEKAKTILPAGTVVLVPQRPLESTEVFHILPDNLYVNGTDQIGFDVEAFIQSHPGWLKSVVAFDGTASRSAAEIISLAARDYSISPRLLLALLEYQSNALSKPLAEKEKMLYPMGYQNDRHASLYNQIMWAARVLNEGYYSWRAGEINYFTFQPDPRQNAASVALENFFVRTTNNQENVKTAISPSGFAATYTQLFGDPWLNSTPHLEKDLQQPLLKLPFETGKAWALTGGPHPGWGSEGGQPWAALDFAPPSLQFGCAESPEWVTAVASGLVVRSEPGSVVLDLDEDGDERSGWVIRYFHIGSKDRVPAGTHVNMGDKIGHASCEGGHATGSHVHIARLYNGEWILAYGPLAFNMEGWVAFKGDLPYQGYLSRGSQIVQANTNANGKALVQSEVLLAVDVK